MSDCDRSAKETLRALLSGDQSSNGNESQDYGEWAEAVASIRDARDRGGTQGARRAFDTLAKQWPALAVLVAGDLENTPTPEAWDCPSLPVGTQPDPELGTGAGAWIDEYIAHALKVSPMTPMRFHESAALWLGSVAIARRLVVPMSFGNIYPNLFIAWIAPTTLWRKTTALDRARKVARLAFPHLMAPQDITPEGFLCDLAGREPAKFDTLPEADQKLWRQERHFAGQRGLALDEVSGLMASSGKDYNAGLLEAFLRLYDCDPLYARSTRGEGRVIVRNAYLTLLGASTPAAMALFLNSERLWSNGWWPRFALLTPETDRPPWAISKEAGDPPTENLGQLYGRLPEPVWPDPPGARAVTLGTGVFDAWQRYAKAVAYDLLTPDLDTQLWGTYGRLPTQALKVATILTALDWHSDNEAPGIELPHLARAVAIVENWRASAHRAIKDVAISNFGRLRQRIMRQMAKQEPNGATYRDICRGMGDVEPQEIELTLMQMVVMGEAEELAISSGPKGGRPTKRYRLARD